jgi:hypothetical protein
LFFQRHQRKNVGGVGADPAGLIRIRHDESKLESQAGTFALIL